MNYEIGYYTIFGLVFLVFAGAVTRVVARVWYGEKRRHIVQMMGLGTEEPKYKS